MRCIWQMDGDKVKGFKCEFSPIDMLMIVSGLKYIVADIKRHPKDRERAQGIYNQIMLHRYYDEADRKTEPRGCDADCNEDCTECAKETELWKAEQTEPQTDGYMTAEQTEDYRKMLDKAEHKVYGNIEDEPQTDCSWK